MTLLHGISVGGAGLALLVIAILSARRPVPALVVLLCLLPFHTGLVLVLRNWLGVGDLLVQMAGAWKEAIIAGLVVAAATRARRSSLSPIAVLGLAFLAVVGLRMGLDVLRHDDLRQVLFGARNISEFAVLVVAVAILRPDREALRVAAWTLVPIGALAAEIAIVVLAFGLPLYAVLYQNAAGTLGSAFLVQFSGEYHPRAAGTYISPNEFGLAMSTLLCAVIGPLWAEGHSRRLLAASATIVGTALLLSYSRSAWLGLAVGSVTIGILLRHRLMHLRSASGGLAADSRLRVGILAGAVIVGILAVSTRAAAFLVATLRGIEPSAAGRPESLSNGLAVFLHTPLGLGLGSAGPKAIGLDPSAILTENWYLVNGIQLGWAGLLVLVLLAGTTSAILVRRVRVAASEDGPLAYGPRLAAGALAALVAALIGGLVIPAFLDLPGSLTIWALAVAAAHLPERSLEPPPATHAPRSTDA